MENTKTALVTGCARRIGQAIATSLHRRGYAIAIHYRNSEKDAYNLKEQFNQARPASAEVFCADLQRAEEAIKLASAVIDRFGKLDALINNASIYPPSPTGENVVSMYFELYKIHMLAPYLLTTALAEPLAKSKGAVVNITDIYAQRPKVDNAIYSSTKAGLESLTKSFAQKLGPDVRVNAVAPGLILWPESQKPDYSLADQAPLRQPGAPKDIAAAVEHLICDAAFTTGQTLAVDGGRMAKAP